MWYIEEDNTFFTQLSKRELNVFLKKQNNTDKTEKLLIIGIEYKWKCTRVFFFIWKLDFSSVSWSEVIFSIACVYHLCHYFNTNPPSHTSCLMNQNLQEDASLVDNKCLTGKKNYPACLKKYSQQGLAI